MLNMSLFRLNNNVPVSLFIKPNQETLMACPTFPAGNPETTPGFPKMVFFIYVIHD